MSLYLLLKYIQLKNICKAFPLHELFHYKSEKLNNSITVFKFTFSSRIFQDIHKKILSSNIFNFFYSYQRKLYNCYIEKYLKKKPKAVSELIEIYYRHTLSCALN